MTISALVVTVDPRNFTATLERLSIDPRITVGDPVGNRVPVVTETDTSLEGDHLYRELRDVDGIWSVDVVMVDFSEELENAS